MTYLITLQDAPADITAHAKRDAEERFRRTLERALGGPDAVTRAYHSWQQTEEMAEADMSAEDIAQVKQWIAAAKRARSDGLRDLGEAEAYFEVRMQR